MRTNKRRILSRFKKAGQKIKKKGRKERGLGMILYGEAIIRKSSQCRNVYLVHTYAFLYKIR